MGIVRYPRQQEFRNLKGQFLLSFLPSSSLTEGRQARRQAARQASRPGWLVVGRVLFGDQG